MKILIVNTFYFPNMVGGTEHSVKLLAEGLKQRGHEVAVYCIDNLQRKMKIEDINGIRVYRGKAGLFNNRIRINRNGNVIQKLINKIIEIRNYSVISEYKSVLNDFAPDIIHTNNLFGMSPLIWKLSKSNCKKLIHTIRDYWITSPTCSLEIENSKSIFIKISLALYRLYFKSQSKYVDVVTAPSNYTLKTFLYRNYFNNSYIKRCVSNCVDINLNETNQIIDEKEKRNSNVIKFIFVGSLYEIKGIKNLLRAFTGIDNENILLTICGDGDFKSLVEEESNRDKRITYKGKLNSTDLKNVLIESDVIIVPSIWDEPFGRVVIEGNQYGNVVIGSNKGGIPEIISEMSSGEVFQYDEVEELRNKISIFSNREYLTRYYSNIRNNIHSYSWAAQIDTFEVLYKGDE